MLPPRPRRGDGRADRAARPERPSRRGRSRSTPHPPGCGPRAGSRSTTGRTHLGGHHVAARSHRSDRPRPGGGHAGPATGRGCGPPERAAPDRGAKTTWTEADKAGFGTARPRRSNVWFTLQRGPDQRGLLPRPVHPEHAQPRAGGHRRAHVHRPRVDRHAARRPRGPTPRSLRFTQVNTDKGGRYRIIKSIVTDPRRDARRACGCGSSRSTGGSYQLYALHDPALGNDGDGRPRPAPPATRAGRATDGVRRRARSCRGPAFDRDLAPATSAASDGWPTSRPTTGSTQALRRRRPGQRRPGRPGLRRHRARRAPHARRWPSASVRTRGGARSARRHVGRGVGRHARRATTRLAPLPRQPQAACPPSAAGVRRQYLASALVLAAAEDKLQPRGVRRLAVAHRGSGVTRSTDSPRRRAPTTWCGRATPTSSAPRCGPMGDKAAARRIVDWLFTRAAEARRLVPAELRRHGQRRCGPSSSSTRSRCRSCWRSLVGRDRRRDVRAREEGRRLPRRLTSTRTPACAAPYSPQERWENQSGYSPNSIAAQIAGLVCAADIARANGDTRLRSTRWLALADEWAVEGQGAGPCTTNGPLSEPAATSCGSPRTATPTRGTTYGIGDGGPSAVDQRRVVDPSFLDLVRLRHRVGRTTRPC